MKKNWCVAHKIQIDSFTHRVSKIENQRFVNLQNYSTRTYVHMSQRRKRESMCRRHSPDAPNDWYVQEHMAPQHVR